MQADELVPGELPARVVYDGHEGSCVLCRTVTVVPVTNLPQKEPLGLLEDIERHFAGTLRRRYEGEALRAGFPVEEVDGPLESHVVCDSGDLIAVDTPSARLVHLYEGGSELTGLLHFRVEEVSLASGVGDVKGRCKDDVALVCFFVFPWIPVIPSNEAQRF